MTEKLCLKWNEFQDNTNAAFGALRNDKDFSDITLACEDGQQVEAHKVILAASSPFFHTMLRRNKHQHPLIYMRGVKSEDLVAIIDFLYYGEANVFQENIDAFLTLAEELELKGLTGNGKDSDKKVHSGTTGKNPTNQKIKKDPDSVTTENIFKSSSNQNEVLEGTEAVANLSAVSGDLQELDDQIHALMAKSENMIPQGSHMIKATICTVCGKEGQFSNIKNHIEANHMEGVSIPCNFCEKTFRSRKGMAAHKRSNHKNC